MLLRTLWSRTTKRVCGAALALLAANVLVPNVALAQNLPVAVNPVPVASTAEHASAVPQVMRKPDATFSDAELRGLFIVERPPLDGFFGVLLTRPPLAQNPNLACWVREHSPQTLTMSDQEGGEVVHVPGIARPPAPKDAKTMTPDDFNAQVREAAQGLRSRCLDIDLAPVADIDDDGHPVRGYDQDPQRAAAWAARFGLAMAAEGITPVLKHYPGRAGTCRLLKRSEFPGMPTNTEVDRCDASADDVWKAADAFPVSTVPIVMLANRIYPSVSLSPAVLDPRYAQRLRQRFHGLVITDALWALNTNPSTVVQALRSADVVMLPSVEEVTAALPALREALADGSLPLADVRAKLQHAAAVKAAILARR